MAYSSSINCLKCYSCTLRTKFQNFWAESQIAHLGQGPTQVRISYSRSAHFFPQLLKLIENSAFCCIKNSFRCLIPVILALPSGGTLLRQIFLLQNIRRFLKTANIIPLSSISNCTVTDSSIISVAWFQNFNQSLNKGKQ